MADIGHAGANENLIDFVTGHIRQGFGIVWVIGAAQDGLFDLIHIDFDNFGVLGVRIGTHQRWIGEPFFHGGDAAFQSASSTIAVGNHPLQQRDIGFQVLSNGFFRQGNGATCC